MKIMYKHVIKSRTYSFFYNEYTQFFVCNKILSKYLFVVFLKDKYIKKYDFHLRDITDESYRFCFIVNRFARKIILFHQVAEHCFRRSPEDKENENF